MTINVLYGLAVYLAGARASYIVLKDLCKLKKVRVLALRSWLTFIGYLIVCNYNNFDE